MSSLAKCGPRSERIRLGEPKHMLTRIFHAIVDSVRPPVIEREAPPPQEVRTFSVMSTSEGNQETCYGDLSSIDTEDDMEYEEAVDTFDQPNYWEDTSDATISPNAALRNKDMQREDTTPLDKTQTRVWSKEPVQLPRHAGDIHASEKEAEEIRGQSVTSTSGIWRRHFSYPTSTVRGDLQRKTSLEFLVKWLGYADEHNSWTSYVNLRDTEKLHEYLTSNNLQRLIPRKFTNVVDINT